MKRSIRVSGSKDDVLQYLDDFYKITALELFVLLIFDLDCVCPWNCILGSTIYELFITEEIWLSQRNLMVSSPYSISDFFFFLLTSSPFCLSYCLPFHRVVEYSLDLQNINLTAIRTVRVLRPLKAINRVPSKWSLSRLISTFLSFVSEKTKFYPTISYHSKMCRLKQYILTPTTEAHTCLHTDSPLSGNMYFFFSFILGVLP